MQDKPLIKPILRTRKINAVILLDIFSNPCFLRVSIEVHSAQRGIHGEPAKLVTEGGVRVRGDAVLRCFWCGFSEIFFNLRYCGFPRLCGLR